MRRSGCRRRRWNTKDLEATSWLWCVDGFSPGFFARQQTFPDCCYTVAERCHPTHAVNAQAHATTARKMMDAFVQPKPNEFESTVRIFEGRDSLATIFSSKSESP